jgi:predicted secreted protein
MITLAVFAYLRCIDITYLKEIRLLKQKQRNNKTITKPFISKILQLIHGYHQNNTQNSIKIYFDLLKNIKI